MVRIESLFIEDIPGLQKGLERNLYERLDAGIILVKGPNASGKSSTVRALQQVLWDRKDRKYRVSVRLKAGEESWRIDLKYGQTEVWKDGAETGERPPQDDFYHRYELSIRELLLRDEEELAKQIQREIYGGVRIDDVMKAERYQETGYSVGKREYKEFAEARKELKSVRTAQEHLVGERKALERLMQRKEELMGKMAEKVVIERAIDFLDQRSVLMTFESDRRGFNPIMEQLLTFPAENILEWEREREQLLLKIGRLDGELSRIVAETEDLEITHRDLQEREMAELGELRENVLRLDQEMQTALRRKTEAGSRLETLSRTFGYQGDCQVTEWSAYGLLERFELTEWACLEGLIDRYHYRLIDLQKTEAEEKLIRRRTEDEELEIPEGDPDSGILVLSDWLQERKNRNALSPVAFGAYVVILIVMTAAFYLWSERENLFYVIVPIVIFSIIYYFVIRQFNKDGSEREEDFQKTGMEAPQEWTRTAVVEKMNQLVGYKVRRREMMNLRIRLAQLTQQREGLAQEIERERAMLNDHRAEISNGLDLSGESVGTRVLRHYLDRINEWQDWNGRYKAASAEEERLQTLQNLKISRFNEILAGTVLGVCHSPEQIAGVYARMAREYQESKNLQQQQKAVQQNLETAAEDFRKIQSRIEEAYKKIGKSEADRGEVWRRLEDLELYRQACAAVDRARNELDYREQEYRRAVGDFDSGEDYTLVPREVLQGRLEVAIASGQELSELNQKIGSITGRIEKTMGEDRLETAIEARDEAKAELIRLFEENLSGNIGKIILDKIQSRHKQENQPKILHRANTILSGITAGRYEIAISGESGRPIFMGFDSVQRRRIPLSELSSGTRIHLLMALRLASIEEQEDRGGGWRMPLFADELLATSDEERTEAIIRHLAAVSSSGRQVFYFTAQQDEIEKWKRYLDGEDGTALYQVIELGEPEE